MLHCNFTKAVHSSYYFQLALLLPTPLDVFLQHKLSLGLLGRLDQWQAEVVFLLLG